VFDRVWISSWGRIPSLTLTRKTFLITSRQSSYPISLSSGRWMSLLKKLECYWWIIVWVMWCQTLCHQSSHRGMNACHNFCTTCNSNLSSSWCNSLWCSQTTAKIPIAVRKRERDR
jgi:hypothetical protein